MAVSFDGEGISAGVDIELAHIFVNVSDDLTGSVCLDNVGIESKETLKIKYRVINIAHVI